MIRIFKYLGIISALTLFGAGFLPWIHIASKELMITGVNSAGTNFGKPAIFHFVFLFFFLLFTIIPKLWAKRINLLVVALNIGWAVRNFLLLSACEAGECPVRQLGIYLVLACSLLMLVAALFPDLELKDPGK